MCCSFVIPFFVFGLRDFFNSPTQFLPMKAGIEWCAALCVPFFVFGLRYFQQSYNFYLWSRIEWCAALLWFLSLCLVLKYFQQSYPISHLQEGWCSFVIPFFTFGLKSIFQQSCNFYLWKQGLSDVLLFVFPFFVFGLKSIFNSHQFLPMKAGISDVLLFVIPFFVFV
jgi:hypothetical protein